MKIRTKRETLGKTLQSFQGLADRKNTMPILSNVKIECIENTMRLYGTDLEVSLIRNVPVEIIDTGETTVSSRKLFEIIKELPDKDITISCDENHILSIECDNIFFKIKGLPSDEFPSFPSYKDITFQPVKTNTIKEMIEKTFYSISVEDIQYNLSGIFIEKVNDAITRFVATDGHRLSMIDRDIEIGLLGEDGIIVPRKGIQEMKRILQEIEDEVNLSIKDNQLIMAHENFVMFIRLIDAIFPNYREVIPESNPIKIKIDRLGFLNSLRRASIVSLDKFRGVKFELQKGILLITSSNPDIGESEERLEISYEGEPLKISFNARYFIEVLSNLTCDQIILELNDDSSPAILKDTEDSYFSAVIMPMRI